MSYFDFVMSEIHGLRIKELLDHKAAGGSVIGTFCLYVPEEIIRALGGISVGLCAGAEWAYDLVEQVLPRNTCALIKSFMGFKMGRVCPYFEACDLVVGETTCDGKKKVYELRISLRST
jgi:benzoyl-CoA reductase/2-hydroxyglutaryl-CoA dehydratase subunit BcrC/BadD/HgdB